MPTVMIIRHGERAPIEKGTFGADVPLTPQGVKEAEQLGKALAELPIEAVYTSPIPRCVHTSKALIKGGGKEIPIHQKTFLGSPGPFVADPELAGPVFLERPLIEIAQDIANGKTLPGMRSLAEGSELFLKELQAITTPLTLMVSHDIIIALLASFLNEDPQVEKYMPDFLDGFWIEGDKNRRNFIKRLNLF